MKKNTLNLGITLALCMLTGCAALEEMQAQIEAEQKAEAQRRAEKNAKIEERIVAKKKRRAEGKRVAADKRRDEEMRRLKEKIRRLDGEDMPAWRERVVVGQIITTEEEMRIFQEMFDAAKRREQKQAEQLMMQAQKKLDDPAFKYPYAAHASGIELYPGIRSGASLEWFLKSGNKSADSEIRLRERSPQGEWIKLDRHDYRGITFIFALSPDSNNAGKLKELKGGLIGVWKVEKNHPSQLRQVIDGYMNAYPGSKHSRTSRNESKKFKNDGIAYDVKNILFVDKLESDKVEIIIESRDIEVKTSGGRSQQELQFAANGMLLALAPQRAIQVTVTDKLLKKYFETLKNNSATK